MAPHWWMCRLKSLSTFWLKKKQIKEEVRLLCHILARADHCLRDVENGVLYDLLSDTLEE